MNEFRKALQSLTASDLSFIHPIPPARNEPPDPVADPSENNPTTSAANTSAPTDDAPAIRDDTALDPISAATPAVEIDDPPKKKRHYVEHEWPPAGTRLVAEYFGTVYHAEVVPADKRLKSGRQLLLLDGPAQGKRLDSYSKAMLVATAKQRKTMNLGRRGVSSGWDFWVVATPGSPPERSPCDTDTNKPQT